MDLQLDDIEARVLGCLIEKELTTPGYYPLTLHSLTAACNQKSNRDPVMSLQETDVVRALDRLRAKHLTGERYGAGMRVAKYEHRVRDKWELEAGEVAILCVLLLRGPQTLGEIRGRTGRMFAFSHVEEVENTLPGLNAREEGPFVLKLPRQPGHKESRFTHLLSGEPDLDAIEATLTPEPATLQVRAENERIEALEAQVQSLQEQMIELKERLEEFKSQFE